MAKQTHINVGGSWKPVKSVWLKVAGTWIKDAIPHIKVSGVWKECMNYISYSLSSFITSLEFHTTDITYPTTKKVGQFIPIAYTDSSNIGQIKLYELSETYTLTYRHGGTLMAGGSYASFSKMIYVDDTHFIVATASNGSSLVLFTIDPVAKTLSRTQTLNHYTTSSAIQSVCWLDSNHFVVAYARSSGASYVTTFHIDVNYTLTEIATTELNSSTTNSISIERIDDTHFIAAYTADSTWLYAYLKTFSVDSSYNISLIDTLSLTSRATYGVEISKITETRFVLAYTKGASDGHSIRTIDIDTSYLITANTVLTHNTIEGVVKQNSLVTLNSSNVLLAYSGSGDDGFLKLFSIASDGTLSQYASLEYDTSNGEYPSIALLDSTHFAVAYRGAADNGFIRTYTL